MCLSRSSQRTATCSLFAISKDQSGNVNSSIITFQLSATKKKNDMTWPIAEITNITTLHRMILVSLAQISISNNHTLFRWSNLLRLSSSTFFDSFRFRRQKFGIKKTKIEVLLKILIAREVFVFEGKISDY